MGLRPRQQATQDLRRFRAAFTHIQMRIGAIADKGVQQVDIRLRHVGVQVVAGDNRHAIPHDAPDQGEQGALRIMVLGREARAMQHAIDAVDRTGSAQISLPSLQQPVEERLLHRAVRFGHGEQGGQGFPGTGRIHVGDEARQLPQHAWSG